MYRLQFFLLLGLLCWTSCGTSQSFLKDGNKKNKEYFQKAAKEASNNNYTKAISYCDKILNKEPENVDALLRKGSYLNTLKKYSDAEVTFAKAIKLAPNYNSLSYYMLGLTQYHQDKFGNAKTNFKTFLDSGKGRKNQIKKAKLLMGISEFSEVALKNPVPFNPVRLPETINTPHHEYLPALTADESQMIYTSRVNRSEDIFISTITEDSFSKGTHPPYLEMPTGTGAHCISPDGKMIIFTSCEDRLSFGSCDLYYIYYRNGKWSLPNNMGKIINTAAWDSQPSLSGDGNTLYFSSKRRGGYGDSDIWSSTKDENGKWTIPINLGKAINTPGKDESPFIHPDDQTLYYRTNGRKGMGDFDIFYSRKEKNNWTTGINIGYPINTDANDGALFVTLDGSKAYYTSDKYSLQNDIEPNLDIYSFDLYPEARPQPTTYVTGRIIDGVTNKNIAATISINNGSTVKEFTTDNSGTFTITLPAYKDYAFQVTKPDYLLYSNRIELKEINSAIDPDTLNVILFPVPKNEVTDKPIIYNQAIVLENVLFESGSANLLPESDFEIATLLKILNDQPEMMVRIDGHTDNVGSAPDNLQLSESRAKSVYNRLIKLGVTNSDRLSFKGFGETVTIASNDTPEGRKQNRRTEFIIIEKK